MAKKDTTNQDRKARLEALRRREAEADRRRTILFAVGTAVVVAAVVGGSIWVVRAGNTNSQIQGLISVDGQTQNHVQGTVKYPQNPPVGGDHAGVWQNCGTYRQPITTENGVHSLEHGAVWITYRTDLAGGEITKLQAAVNAKQYVLLSPFAGLSAPVVASAWGKQVVLTGADDPRLAAFIRAYAGGPQSPEPGAACVGGTGEPN